MKLPHIHFDCKYFEGDKPCFPNKQNGVFCEKCSYYEKGLKVADKFPIIGSPNSVPEKNNESLRILIIKLDAVGDVLRTTSVLPSFKYKYPKSHITWLTKSASYEILKNNKFITNVCIVDNDNGEITKQSFDIAVNLDNGKDSCLIMNNISARERFGFGLVNGKPYPLNELANEWYLMGINDNVKKANSKTYHKLMHDICRLEYRNTKPYLAITSELAAKTELIKKNIGLDMFKKFILVNLGGGNRWQYKKWTIEGYSELLNNLTLSVRNTAIGVIAGAEDRTFYYETVRLISKKDHTLLLGCDNSLEDFISIISLADKVFTSDSLALHISTALGKFTVCIVGPTSHSELDIFGNGKIIYSSKVDCLSCYLNTCNKKVNCMNTVFAKEVIGYLL